MTEFAKMDIFFFITTIVVVILGALAALILFRIWRILGHAERIADMVEGETALVREDIGEMRASVRREGFKWKFVVRFIKKMIGKR